MSNPQRLKDLLQGAGARLGMGGAVETGLVWSRWNDIVGDTVAAHAEPTSLREGVLRIRTDSPTWATEVGYLGQEIKRAANQVARKELVAEVRVWTAPGAIASSGPEPRQVYEPVGRRRPEVGQEDPRSALERARDAWSRRHEEAR